MVLRPTLRLTLFVVLGLAAFATLLVAYEAYRFRQALIEFEHHPLPASAADHRDLLELPDDGPEPPVAELTMIPAELYAPRPLTYLPAGAESPIQSAIPMYRYTSSARSVKVSLPWGQPRLVADGLTDHVFSLQSGDELEKFSFAAHEDRLIVVLVGERDFEVYVAQRGGPIERRFAFDNYQPWTDPVTRVAYEDGLLSIQGPFDSPPWNVGQEWLRIFDVDSGTQLVERDVSALNVQPLPTWRWPEEDQERTEQVCDGEWVAGCEPPRLCEGELSARRLADATDHAEFPHAQLHIRRSWSDAVGSVSCQTTLRPPAGTEFRLQHDRAGVVVFGRNDTSRYVWRYDLDCRLVDRSEVPN